jgi:UDP-glucose 4-epimerase
VSLAHGRFLVTGGAGFIGSHVVDRLLAAGHEVVVLDDLSSGSLAHLPDPHGTPGLRIAVADIRDSQVIDPLFQGIDYVLHMATRDVRSSLRQPTMVHDVNVNGTLNVLKAAAAHRVRRLLYCSSSEVYGTATKVPMGEDYDFKPETLYGASKLAGEYYAQVFQRSGWLETVIARPHNTYGPREYYEGNKGEVIPRFIVRALADQPPTIYGDGSQTRDFTFVGETAEYLVRVLIEGDPGEVYNICRGQEVSIRRIAELVKEVSGLTADPVFLPGRPSDVLRLYGDPTKLIRKFTSAPRIGIQEGLKTTFEWFRANVQVNAEVLAKTEPQYWTRLPAESWIPGERG